MNVLLITQYFWPEGFRVNDIATEYQKRGNKVTVLTGLPNYPTGVIPQEYKKKKNRIQIYNDVKVVRSFLIERGKRLSGLALNYVSFALASIIPALTKIPKKDYKIILVYQVSPVSMIIPGIVLKYLYKKPLVIYCHDLWPASLTTVGINDKGFFYKIVKHISRFIYSQADELVISSKSFEMYLRDELHLKNTVTYLPVYAEDLFGDIQKNINPKETLDLVFAGNIGEIQGVEDIIETANLLKNAKDIIFHIVGDGTAHSNCVDLAKKYSLNNVVFHGRHPIEKMKEFYDKADAFLVSMKKNEIVSYTLPNKVQSYLAAGKPVLGMIDGETNSIIHESDCGYCVEAENFQAFAEKIIEFKRNAEKHQEFGENAKRYYENNFSKKDFFEKLDQILQKTYRRVKENEHV
ncbi:glycosyltransferase WbuB [Exiguobacterium sp. KRL4]|nr:glycosyltransferase WbuB [Exiguobacterium sp. KRL4]